jgi:hypothetical protein
MPHYFINNHALPNGDHEVHRVGCARMPSDKGYLGNFDSMTEAMIEARKEFWHSNSCVHCGGEHRVPISTVRKLAATLFPRTAR